MKKYLLTFILIAITTLPIVSDKLNSTEQTSQIAIGTESFECRKACLPDSYIGFIKNDYIVCFCVSKAITLPIKETP